jgi:hypothetical protein
MTEPFVIAGDNHGDEQNDMVTEKFFEWLDDFDPSIVIHGGDNWNFAALRRKATPEERQQSITPDFEAGQDFMKRLFSHGKKRFFTRGNHDERIYSLAREAKDAAVSMLAGKLTADIDALMRKLRARVLPYDSRLGVLDVDGVRSIHGYAAGIGAARKFAHVYGTCAFNHTHSMDVAPAEHWPEVSIAYGVGCLCHIDQPYNHTQPGKLRHENGWVYGYTDGKRATYFQARFKNGQVYAAEKLKAY